jgi:hypothetical protein
VKDSGTWWNGSKRTTIPEAVYAILLVGEAISMIDVIDSVKTLPICGDRNSTSTSVYISNPKHPSIATGTKIPIPRPIPYPLQQSLPRTDSYFVHDHPTSLPFKPQSTADIHLPTPPFTPAALHFCLGYMYAGHLDFSNRTFDLSTAFAIYRAAMYLQLEALVQEIESRIVHDFCHGLNIAKCKCRRCPLRAARVWRFATEPDIGAIQLRNQARRYVVEAWGQTWGREVGLATQEEKDSLVKEVCDNIKPNSIITTWRNVQAVRTRMENGSMAKGREATAWVDPLGDMIEQVESRAREVLIGQFASFAESSELWKLVSGKGFDGEILDTVAQEIVGAVGTVKGCLEGPKVYQVSRPYWSKTHIDYQALVSSLLLKVDPNTLGPALPPRSRSRQQIEQAREGVLAHIRRRWTQIRDAGGFHNLENWALKEISDG